MTDVLAILAILTAPLVALQVSRWLAERKETRERQIQIFRTLMTTSSPLKKDVL